MPVDRATLLATLDEAQVALNHVVTALESFQRATRDERVRRGILRHLREWRDGDDNPSDRTTIPRLRESVEAGNYDDQEEA